MHQQIVVVTGGTSGIGAASALALVDYGFLPIVLDLKVPDRQDPRVRYGTPLDVTKPDEVATSIADIETRYGPIVGLVHSAGNVGKMHPPEKVRIESWDREIALHLRGTFIVCREVGVRMAGRKKGSIVTIASIAGTSSAPVLAYSAAKAGIINLTMNLAAAWGKDGVRVNAVSPGFTLTPALQHALDCHALDADAMSRGAALRRLVDPKEVGQAVAWLVSDRSSAVTGVNLPVDAGYLAGMGWRAYGNLSL